MLRILFIFGVIFFLVWIYMGGTTKTIADYKNYSKEELEELCLDKKDKTACQKIAVDFVKQSKH